MTMSFISKQSSTASILKQSSIRRTLPGRTMKFQLSSSFKSLLVSYLTEKNRHAFVEMISYIRNTRDQLTDEEFIQIISEMRDCISILDEKRKQFVVEGILSIKWCHRNESAVNLYKTFLVDLCSVHNYHAEPVIQQLVSVFSEVVENSLHCGCTPSEQEERAFQNVHEVIRNILKIIPLSRNSLLNAIKSKYPYLSWKDRSHLNFVHNLLTIATYESALRKEILRVIVTQLMYIDTRSSKEEIEKAENDSKNATICQMEVHDIAPIDDITLELDMVHDMARKMDFCLYCLYKYIYNECHNKNNKLKWDETDRLYQDFLPIFEEVILITQGWNHTQFIILYLISFKPKLTGDFVTYLWNKVTNTTLSPVTREAAVYYLAGFLCHASFVSPRIVKNMLQNIIDWLHNYIDAFTFKDEDQNAMMRVHAVFYSTCQALFYLINFRHKEFVNSNKGLKFLANLNLGKIVMSHFKPLQVCKRPIVNQLIKILKTYQLVYCVSILSYLDSKSASSVVDLWLDGSFPFHSYILKRSNEFINPILRQLGESCNTQEKSENDVSDDEDFIPVEPLCQSPVVPIISPITFTRCKLEESCMLVVSNFV